MSEAFRNIWDGLAAGSWLDQLNLVLGVVGVWLMIKRTLWAFPIGLVGVVVQGVLFFQTRFYADAMLQIFFLGALAWGWWHWVRDRGVAPELPVTMMTWRARFITLALATAATVGWALALRRWTNAVMPWRDAFIAAFQVAAQILQARKNLENWPLWVVANGVAVAAYWWAGLAFTTFLFAIYLVMSFMGWREWSRAMKTPTTHG